MLVVFLGTACTGDWTLWLMPDCKAIALGKNVIVVYKGKALQIAEGEGETNMSVSKIKKFFKK